MVDLIIDKDGETTKYTYILKPDDRIDNVTLGMMVNNQILGFVPMKPLQDEEKRYLEYTTSNKITMAKYLGEIIKRERLINAFLGISTIIKNAVEYLINATSFALEPEKIMIDEVTGEVELICIPLLTASNNENLCAYFKRIMFESQFDLDENGDYIGRLITSLNPKNYSLDSFINELQLLKDNKSESNKKRDNVDKSETTKEVEDDVETAEKRDSLAEQENNVNGNELEEQDNESIYDNAMKNQHGLYGAYYSDEVANDTNTTGEVTRLNNDSDDIAYYQEMQSSEYSSSSYYNNVYQNEETQNNENVPFMIKQQNGSKVYINKDIFKIGANRDEVNYYIAGNHTIAPIHAIFKHNDSNEYFMTVENSKFETYMNGVLITPDEEIYVPHGAVLRFGTEEFEFKMH